MVKSFEFKILLNLKILIDAEHMYNTHNLQSSVR